MRPWNCQSNIQASLFNCCNKEQTARAGRERAFCHHHHRGTFAPSSLPRELFSRQCLNAVRWWRGAMCWGTSVYTKPTPDVPLLMREEMVEDGVTRLYPVLIEVGLFATSRKQTIREITIRKFCLQFFVNFVRGTFWQRKKLVREFLAILILASYEYFQTQRVQFSFLQIREIRNIVTYLSKRFKFFLNVWWNYRKACTYCNVQRNAP